MDYLNEQLIVESFAGVTKHYPNRKFGFGHSSACDWAFMGFSFGDIKALSGIMPEYDAVFQTNLCGCCALCCELLREEGMVGYYEKIQKPALAGAIPGRGMIEGGAYLAESNFKTLMARDNHTDFWVLKSWLMLRHAPAEAGTVHVLQWSA